MVCIFLYLKIRMGAEEFKNLVDVLAEYHQFDKFHGRTSKHVGHLP
jgi:hypothetical protein